MNPVSGTVIFIVIWWLVFFISLPIGIQRHPDLNDGGDPGAPANPRLGLKAVATTGVSIVIFIIVFLAVQAELVDVFGRGG